MVIEAVGEIGVTAESANPKHLCRPVVVAAVAVAVTEVSPVPVAVAVEEEEALLMV